MNKSHQICDVCGYSGTTTSKTCPSCWNKFPAEGQVSAHTGEVVGGAKKKRARPDPWWTIVFINREGQPLMFNAKPGWTERGPVDWCSHEQGPEKDVLDFIHVLMRDRTELSRLPPTNTYAAGIWSGKIRDKKELETIRPRFYVYEGGSVHTVT